MTVPHRCTNRVCRTRKTFAKRWDEYVRPPKCPTCGRVQWAIPADMHRNYKWRKVCRCGGLDYPHRWGSKGCYDHPGEIDMRDAPEVELDEQLAKNNGYRL